MLVVLFRSKLVDARHLIAQKTGRERWYEYYTLEVAEVKRTKEFARPTA
jgi:hypothetical protein